MRGTAAPQRPCAPSRPATALRVARVFGLGSVAIAATELPGTIEDRSVRCATPPTTDEL
jgi:hypothetical protein